LHRNLKTEVIHFEQTTKGKSGDLLEKNQHVSGKKSCGFEVFCVIFNFQNEKKTVKIIFDVFFFQDFFQLKFSKSFSSF